MKRRTALFWAASLIGVFVFAVLMAQAPESTTKIEPSKTESADVSALKVDKIACGTGVADRELEGQDSVFTESTEKIYCWALIMGGSEGTTVNFVWYHDGKEVVKIPLSANYSRTRTWSYKSMFAGSKGDWKVDVIDSNNQVLASTSFKVQ